MSKKFNFIYKKISLLTFGFLTIYDAHLCLENLYFALYNYVII